MKPHFLSRPTLAGAACLALATACSDDSRDDGDGAAGVSGSGGAPVAAQLDRTRARVARAQEVARDPAEAAIWREGAAPRERQVLQEPPARVAPARTSRMLVDPALFNALNSRSEHRSAFVGLFGRPLLWVGIASSVALQFLVVSLSALNVAFRTVPMSLRDWMWWVAMASVVLWVDELEKVIVRRVMRGTARLEPLHDSVERQ